MLTPAVAAAVHPQTSVHVWDPSPARLAGLASVARDAALSNLVIQERPGPPDESIVSPCDLVVVDGVLDSSDPARRDQVLDAACSLLRPGALMAVAYRTVVGWGEVVPLVRLLRHRVRLGQRKSSEVLAPLEGLRAHGAAYPAVRPAVGAWLDDLLDAPSDEVVGSYLADDLRPASHAQVSEALAAHAVDFVSLAQQYDPLEGAPPVVAQRVRAAASVVLRETLADLAIRRTARVDVYRLGRCPVEESVRNAAVLGTSVMETRLAVAETVGVPWARPVALRECLPTDGSSSSDLQRGGSCVRELWPGESALNQERLAGQALAAGSIHPVRDELPDGAAESTVRLTATLLRSTRPEQDRFAVSARLGTALPATYTHSLSLEHRHALGIGAS
ncbi:MAG: methyltransferase regulatory domain-containing protein [Microthrixaceae bacterium]